MKTTGAWIGSIQQLHNDVNLIVVGGKRANRLNLVLELGKIADGSIQSFAAHHRLRLIVFVRPLHPNTLLQLSTQFQDECSPALGYRLIVSLVQKRFSLVEHCPDVELIGEEIRGGADS